MKISKYLGLDKIQAELDFVDVDIKEDITLFIDPWAIKKGGDDFSIECNNIIVNYFSKLVQSIASENKSEAMDLLSQLKEPKETHLGFSSKSFDGSGISAGKADLLFNALSESNAVKTGFLKDIEDTALLINGIRDDNISDLVTNLLRGKLIEYTQRQCKLYGIGMQKLPTGYFWDPKHEEWTSDVQEMLVINGQKVILVPKLFVRKSLSVNFKQYYTFNVLEYEQMYHLNNNTSLCRVLKGGYLGKPYKKVLKEEHSKKDGGLKNYVYNFTKNNPEVLKHYKENLGSSDNNYINENEGLEKRIDELKLKLQNIKPGKAEAYLYEETIFDILEVLFSSYLYDPIIQDRKNDGLKIIDISYRNHANKGFFMDLSKSNISCREIYFECKNYSGDIKNPEFDQINGRFSNKICEIGFIVCRKNDNKEDVFKRCEFLARQKHYIIVLEDEDLNKLLDFKKENKEKDIQSFLNNRLNNLLK